MKAEPFRPFRIQMASGKSCEGRHPEMIKVMKSYVYIFSSTSDDAEFPDAAQSVSLMLAEAISHREVPVQ